MDEIQYWISIGGENKEYLERKKNACIHFYLLIYIRPGISPEFSAELIDIFLKKIKAVYL